MQGQSSALPAGALGLCGGTWPGWLPLHPSLSPLTLTAAAGPGVSASVDSPGEGGPGPRRRQDLGLFYSCGEGPASGASQGPRNQGGRTVTGGRQVGVAGRALRGRSQEGLQSPERPRACISPALSEWMMNQWMNRRMRQGAPLHLSFHPHGSWLGPRHVGGAR